MDVVYPYRRASDEFELRYSLRSLVHVPHDRVIVSGDQSRIVSDKVVSVDVHRCTDRYFSSTLNIVSAVRRAGITGDFVVMNDDFFVLRPWSYQREHRGTITEYVRQGEAQGSYRFAVKSTQRLLRERGVAEPLFFGVHSPAVYNAERLLALFDEFQGESYLLKTLYCNLYPQPSAKRGDVKVRRWTGEALPDDVLSTSDGCARDPAFRRWIAQRFPHPCEYELGGADRMEAA